MLMKNFITNPKKINNNENNGMFYLIIIFLLLDYGRLHETFHLSFAKPLMVIILLLIIMILLSGQLLSSLKNKQIKLMWLFIFLLALYIPFARNNYWAYDSTKTMFLYMPFVISTIICINSINRLKKMMLFSLALHTD